MKKSQIEYHILWLYIDRNYIRSFLGAALEIRFVSEFVCPIRNSFEQRKYMLHLAIIKGFVD